MDDLKLTGLNKELRDEIRIAKTFSNDINMEFRIEKCANISVNKKVRAKERNM
jgi:hypothetical protein